MVRVISEKLFSPPRSRHSSGETVDKELAARAVEVLSSLNSRRLELSDYESSSDSHWDSEVDVEGDGGESSTSKDLADCGDKQADVLRKRKERRRERNKLSAQAYRVRRKEQTVKQQTVLQTLQEENSRLKSMVSSLEDQMQKVRHSLRHRGFISSLTQSSTSPRPSEPSIATTTTTTTQADTPSGVKPVFGSVCSKTTEAVHPAMDNDHSHKQHVCPEVDNFLFSKPLPTPTNTPTPPPPTGATPTPTPFSFHAAPVFGGVRHGFGGPAPFLTNPLPTISEKPDSPFVIQHHPKARPQDFNANANSTFTPRKINANTINSNSNIFEMYHNSNNNRLINNNQFHTGDGADVRQFGSPSLAL